MQSNGAFSHTVFLLNLGRQVCVLSQRHILSCTRQLYSGLSWRSLYLHLALRAVLRAAVVNASSDGKSGLRPDDGVTGLLELLVRGGVECAARKIMVYHSSLKLGHVALLSLRQLDPPADSCELPGLEVMKELRTFFADFIDEYKVLLSFDVCVLTTPS